jgi:hypothetical protein
MIPKPNKALLSDIFSATLQNCRRARRYMAFKHRVPLKVYKKILYEVVVVVVVVN